MREVSCRAFQYFEREARHHGVELEEILAGTGLDLAVLRDPAERVDWDAWALACDRFMELIGGPEAMRESGHRVIQLPIADRFRRLVAGVVSVEQVYGAASRWFIPMLYRGIVTTCERRSQQTLRVTARVEPGRRPSAAWFHVLHGALEATPILLGLDPARVDARIDGCGGTYLVELPEPPSFLARARRVGRALFSLDSVFGELTSLQDEVTAGYRAQLVAEAALARTESTYRALLEALPDLIVRVTRDGEVMDVAAGSQWRLPFAPGDLVGESPDQYASVVPSLDPMVLAEGMPKVQHTADTGEPTHLEFVLRLGEDARNVEVQMVRCGAGEVLAVVRDTTDRKKVDARLAMADRLASLGTLAAGVAHEVNNPLTYMLTNLGDLRRSLEPSASWSKERAGELRDLVVEAEDGANRVRQIVSDLRTFAPSPHDDDRTLVDVERILDSMIGMASNEIRHRATLVRAYEGVGPVLASEARLGQVFLNLLVNAAQAIPEGAAHENRIQVRTRQSGDDVVVEVSDTGVGIPEGNLARIFDPFFTTKSREMGTGLGLAICHQMLRRYGGDIEVQSQIGRGSTFRVTLPAAVVPADDGATPRVATVYPPRPPGRFLVIDDDPAVARSLSRLLRPHDVRVARDGFEALRALETEGEYQGILCDVMMPAMSGQEFYERLQEARPDLVARFAFVTGGAFTEGAQTFLRSVDVPTLQKPFDSKELQRLVERLLSA